MHRPDRQGFRLLLQLLSFALLLPALLLPLKAAGQAPPFPILDSTTNASLGLFLARHEDSAGEETINDLRKLPPESFLVSETPSFRAGYTRSTWWFRIALQNTQATDITLLLEVPHPELSLVEFYRPITNGYAITRSGTSTERVIGDLEHQHYFFRAPVPANTTEIFWFRVQSNTAFQFSLNSETPESVALAQSIPQISIGVLIGILLALILLNGIAWYASRHMAHLWYLLFTTAATIHVLSKLGYIGVLFFRVPGLQAQVETASALIASLAMLQFSRAFLETRENQIILDRLLGHLALAGSIALLAAFFIEAHQRAPIFISFGALTIAATLYAGWIAARKKLRHAPTYLIARMIGAGGAALAVSTDFDLLPITIPATVIMFVSIGIEASILTLALNLKQKYARHVAAEQELNNSLKDAKLSARSEFLTHFSHDIRTPLNGVLGMSELLADTSLTPRQREYTLTIRNSGNNLLALLNEAVDWSRLECGQLEIQHIDFDLSRLIYESAETIQLRAEEKHLELIVDIDPVLPTQVNGDPSRLRQVLCNLLSNAVRYTHRGDIHIQAVPDTTPHQIRIEIRDTGIGMTRTQLATLFNKPAARKPIDSGEHRGFGLVIASQLLDRMGGSINVLSEEHCGSTFRITLPLPATPEQISIANVDLLNGKRLLIVDDNSTVRHVLATQATRWGMRTAAANHGQEALAMARTQSNIGTPFDAVVLDHNMPGMSGLQLAARLKEDPLIRHDPLIIMLTGLNIAPTEPMARNVGIRRVLTKPISGRMLQTVLAEEFSRRERFEPDEANSTELPASMRILVVEDHRLSQKVIRGMLAKLGVRSDLASNGQEALDAVLHHRYDLVLMDCEMPIMDGYEATRRIRAWETDTAQRRVPIVALSAHTMNEIKIRCQHSGMDAHMAKPVDLNELRETLRIYCTMAEEKNK